MSEYQSYEFQSIDRLLTAEERSYLNSLSSRAKVTSNSAFYLYNFSDFSQDPEKLVDRCFDMMVYVASYGIRQLIIRLPRNSINPDVFKPYLTSSFIETSVTEKSILLDINLRCDDYGTWIEDGARFLPDLIGLREELISGDLRLLYLAWLKIGCSEDAPDPIEEMIEPPVPPNLGQLSPSLEAFAETFMINEDLISVAAEVSESQKSKQKEPWKKWIATLSEADRNAYLLRVVEGDLSIGAELKRTLRQSCGEQSMNAMPSPGRSLAELVALSEQKEKEREQNKKVLANITRTRYLNGLIAKLDALWLEVDQQLEFKSAKGYDRATTLLKDLSDQARLTGNSDDFQRKLDERLMCNSSPAWRSRLRTIGLF
jgi:hypothetical protein